MRLSGKLRYGFALVLVGFAVLALAVGGWLFFATFSRALIQAASGTVSAATHLNDLLQLQWAVLIGVTALVAVLVLALVMMVAAHEGEAAQMRNLLHRIEALARGNWQDASDAVPGDGELSAIAEALRGLAAVMSARAVMAGGAQSAEDIKSRFLEIIAHQLRTPLTAVRWNLESLVKGDLGPLKKRQQDLLEITAKNHQGILVMLSDWVEALEVERGLLQLNLESTDMHAMTESLLHDFQGQAKLKRQKFVVRMGRGLPKVHADHLKMRYILTKLLSNAMGYTPERGVVTMRVTADNRFARVEVTDSGVGIPYEDQPNVFKKFFRASNAALMQPNASGVGLFVTKTLVEAMGGTIDFRSEEGKGTTFWFTVPKLLVSGLPVGKPPKRR